MTIETASDNKHPYAVTEKAYAALLDLVTDICRRNGAKRLLWFADKERSLAYEPQDGEMVMTVHRWFANKSCPGDYLYERHGAIATEVTKRLSEEDEDMDEEKFYSMFKAALSKFRGELRDNDSGDWSKEARDWCVSVGLFAGNGTTDGGEANMMWEDFLTREQAAQLFYRFAKTHGLV